MKAHLILFGPPGSGKGTQSALLTERFGFRHLSTGELLRAEIKKGTPQGAEIKTLIEGGSLVPDSFILALIDHLVGSLSESDAPLILDGFPRTQAQALGLEEILSKYGQRVGYFVELQVPRAELTERLIKRGEQEGRADDTPQTIVKRIDLYEKTMAPIEEFYRRRGLCHIVDGTGSVEEIAGRIARIIAPEP